MPISEKERRMDGRKEGRSKQRKVDLNILDLKKNIVQIGMKMINLSTLFNTLGLQ